MEQKGRPGCTQKLTPESAFCNGKGVTNHSTRKDKKECYTVTLPTSKKKKKILLLMFWAGLGKEGADGLRHRKRR